MQSFIIRESSKRQIYNIFKTVFGFEKYFNLLTQKLEQHLFDLEPHISCNQNWEIVWHLKTLKNLPCLQ